MAQYKSYLTLKIRQVEQKDVLVDSYEPAFPVSFCGQDIILPNYYLLLIHQGTARVLYDMQEKTLKPNVLVLVLPGHLIRFIDRSDDLVFSRLVIKPDLFNEMLNFSFSHDVNKFHSFPGCLLTDEQVSKLMKVLDLLETITRHEGQELQQRRQLLLAQLTVGYEFINYYRNEVDKQRGDSSKMALLNRFCDLVVTHFRESREVKFYAEKLHIHPYHLTRTIREASGGQSPADWIEQYIVTIAKRMIEIRPDQSLKQTAYQLGFSEPTSFYRYFKHATGITAKEYRNSLPAHE